MTNKHYAKAIILGRIDFGEADRVLTLLSPNDGKIHVLAKGVRKEKSKLAGGIELFSEVEIGFVKGRGDLATLVSSRLIKFYDQILKDIDKVQLMYQILKTFDKTTEDNVDSEYYYLLLYLLKIANMPNVKSSLLDLYYKAQLLKLTGHLPNLQTDNEGHQLDEKSAYNFDLSSMSMAKAGNGRYRVSHLKYLRLLFTDLSDNRIFKLSNTEQLVKDMNPLIDAMMKSSLSI
jgi:DNA repair protein RecO (recombination protein O)